MPRITPEDEIDKMSDRLDGQALLIQDRDSFDLAIQNVWQLEGQELSPKQIAFRDDVFRLYLSNHPTVRPDRLHSKALTKKDKVDGFTLKRDRRTTETIVRTDQQFIEKGARKFDFAGFDVKESEITLRKIRSRKEFVIPAIINKKVVFVKKDFVNVRGKEVVVYRDKTGRFASLR